MKISILLAVTIAACSTTTLGQTSHVHSMTPTASAPTAVEAKTSSTHHVSGVVKKVDPAAKTVTLDHEAVKSLSWPPMTMTFKVDDPAEMRKLKPGAKVDVDMVQRGNDYVVTAVR